jgi:hypothetical protein
MQYREWVTLHFVLIQKRTLLPSGKLVKVQQQPDDVSFKNGLADYAKQIGKNGLSILADMGAYHHRSKYNELLDHELSLPTKFDDIAMKGFCLYHQKDFDKLSEQQKQKLIEHHGKAIKII